MAAKTRKTEKSPKGEMTEEQKEAVIQKSRQTVSSLEKNLAIYENDLKRNGESLKNLYGVASVDEALAKVEEENQKLPALQAERDDLVVQLQDYLSKQNL